MLILFINSYQISKRDQWKEKHLNDVGLTLAFVEASEVSVELLEVNFKRYERRSNNFCSYSQICLVMLVYMKLEIKVREEIHASSSYCQKKKYWEEGVCQYQLHYYIKSFSSKTDSETLFPTLQCFVLQCFVHNFTKVAQLSQSHSLWTVVTRAEYIVIFLPLAIMMADIFSQVTFIYSIL